MRQVALVLVGLLAAHATAGEVKYPHGWEHSAPPPGDEFLTNRFGHSWSVPIYEGVLVVSGQYVSAWRQQGHP